MLNAYKTEGTQTLFQKTLLKFVWARTKTRKHIKSLKQVFSFRKESKTTTPTKSKPCTHVLSCSAKFNDLLCRGLCKKKRRRVKVS